MMSGPGIGLADHPSVAFTMRWLPAIPVGSSDHRRCQGVSIRSNSEQPCTGKARRGFKATVPLPLL